jgi:hypothetical protein
MEDDKTIHFPQPASAVPIHQFIAQLPDFCFPTRESRLFGGNKRIQELTIYSYEIFPTHEFATQQSE